MKNNERFKNIVYSNLDLVKLEGEFGYSWKLSLLHVACDENNIPCIDVLLDNGCPLNQKDEDGNAPKHHAVMCGHIESVERLLLQDQSLINCVNVKYGKTSLHCAAGRNQEEMVKFLLTQPYVDVNIKDIDNKMADDYTCNENIKRMLNEYQKTK